jgi:hypothetical protein
VRKSPGRSDERCAGLSKFLGYTARHRFSHGISGDDIGEQMDGVGALEYVDDNIATRSRKKEFAIEFIWTLNGLPKLR